MFSLTMESLSFSARKPITIHLHPNKNVSAVPDDISERNIGGSTPECDDFIDTSLQLIMWIICA